MCAEVRRSIVSIHCRASIGTGWIASLREDGLAYVAATARHVISDAISGGDPIEIRDESSAKPVMVVPESKELLHDENLDFAVFVVHAKPPGPGLKMRHRVHEKEKRMWLLTPSLGVEVGWIGFPESTMIVFGRPVPTFCRGQISAVSEKGGNTFFCLDGNINRGMSGAPVWDAERTVMGMLQAFVAPPSRSSQEPVSFPGFGIVLPISYIAQSLPKLGVHFFSRESKKSDA
jgi:hypothetical protein